MSSYGHSEVTTWGGCWTRLASCFVQTEGLPMRFCAYPKGVHVRCYVRFRFDKWENVCEHCRSYPGQMELFH